MVIAATEHVLFSDSTRKKSNCVSCYVATRGVSFYTKTSESNEA